MVGLAGGLLAGYMLLRSWRDRHAQTLFDSWRTAEEELIRLDAASRSEAVLRGRISEQFAPVSPAFPFNPSDARFLGSPVDFVVFDGYTEVAEGLRDSLRAVVLVDAKSGKAALTWEQKRIKRCVEEGLVSFELIGEGL